MWLVPQAIATAVMAPVVAAAPFLIPAVFGRPFEGTVTPLKLLLPGVSGHGADGAAAASAIGYAAGAALAWTAFGILRR